MKILLTGGGTGGHFYPIIAVAEAINKIAEEERLLGVDLFYMSDRPYDEALLFSNNIVFKKIYAGKLRRYFSILNVTDLFKTGLGIIRAFLSVFSVYPDVIFGKGGYASFPAILAGRLLRIPIVIHESDTVPGRLNMWASRFAFRIAVSYPEAAEALPQGKVAFTGNPIRTEVMNPVTEGAQEFFGFDKSMPAVLVLGGSSGAEALNDVVLGILPDILTRYHVIHQTGRAQFKKVEETAKVVLGVDNPLLANYKPLAYLDDLAMRTAAGAATVIITRAGSALFEIAIWGKPAIVIPIADTNGDHQRKNAYSYARKTGAVVIEEANLSDHLLISEIDRIVTDPARIERMQKGARSFAIPDAAEKIAREILNIALGHEM